MSLWLGAVALGLGFAAMCFGVYLSFRILSFPDLTIDGSFALGGAVSATLIALGWGAWPSLLPACLLGAAAGATTGLLTTRLGVNGLLASILVMIGLYSVNLRIMGRSNQPLLGVDVVTTWPGEVAGESNLGAIGLFALATMLILGALVWFLHTDLGLALRAAGSNEAMVRALGVDTDHMKVLGLTIANGLIGLSGALIAQFQGFADVNMGLGMIVSGLAAVVLGESILRPASTAAALVAVTLGSILYRLVIALALVLGLAPTDLKLGTAAIVLLALASPALRRRFLPARAGARLGGPGAVLPRTHEA
jgi:putative ABC transport system permease protein